MLMKPRRACKALPAALKEKFERFRSDYIIFEDYPIVIVATSKYILIEGTIEWMKPLRSSLFLIKDPAKHLSQDYSGEIYFAIRCPEDYKETYKHYFDNEAGSVGEIE